MNWIGLTGGIACGKSQVAKFMEELGVSVIYADRVAHEALESGRSTFSQIVKAFGPGVLGSDGELDRTQLGKIVFADTSQKAVLESIVHPYVQQKVQSLREKLAEDSQNFALYEVPLLFEKGMQSQFHEIVTVSCDPQVQLERLMTRNALSREQADLRLKSQWALKKKEDLSDHLIMNNGSLQDLQLATERVFSKLSK